MYAVAFDLVVADTEQRHPKGVSQAYADIGSVLNWLCPERTWLSPRAGGSSSF